MPAKVTIDQLMELLEQAKREQITGNTLQEFLDRSARLPSPHLLKQILDAARKAAEGISDSYWRSKAFADIAGAYAQAKDFEAARKAAEGIDNSNWRSKAFADIAGEVSRALTE